MSSDSVRFSATVFVLLDFLIFLIFFWISLDSLVFSYPDKPTGKPVGFLLSSVPHNRTPFSGFGMWVSAIYMLEYRTRSDYP